MSQSLSHYSQEPQAAATFHGNGMLTPKVEAGTYNSGHATSAIVYSKPTGTAHSLMTSQQGSNVVQHLQQSQLYPQINPTQAHVQQNSYSNQVMHPLADGSGLQQNLQQHYTSSNYHNQRPPLRYTYQAPCQSQQSSMSYGMHLNPFSNHSSLYTPQYQYQHQASAPNQQTQLQQQQQQQGVGCMQQSPSGCFMQHFGTYPQCSPPHRSHQQIATNLTMQNQGQQPSPTSGMGWVNTGGPVATATRPNCNNFQSGISQSGNGNGNVSAGTFRASTATPTVAPQLPTPQTKSPTTTTTATGTGIINQQQPQQQLQPSRLQLNDPSTLPGGLEVLWKEVPEECKKLMTLQDIPLTATARGYFTVCELLVLKRSLEARLFGYARPPRGQSSSKGAKGEARLTRGAKRKPPVKAKVEEPVQHAPVTSSDNDNADAVVFIKKVKYDGNVMNEVNADRSNKVTIMDLAEICKTEIEELEGEEPLINYNGTKEEIRTSTPPPVSGVGVGIGVGVAVKEAMETLTTTQFSPISSDDGDGDVEGTDPGEILPEEEDERKDVMKIENESDEEQREERNPGENENEQAETDAVKDEVKVEDDDGDGEQRLAIAE